VYITLIYNNGYLLVYCIKQYVVHCVFTYTVEFTGIFKLVKFPDQIQEKNIYSHLRRLVAFIMNIPKIIISLILSI